MNRRVAWTAVFLAATACSGGGKEGPAVDTFPAASLPATFTGDLPCADCPGIRHHLDVYADGAYVLRLTYLDTEGDPDDTVGRWTVSPDGKRLVLGGGTEPPVRCAIVSPDSLRLLNRDGTPIVSNLNYTLVRAPAFDPVEPRLTLRGMYCYLADAGVFTECRTGWRLPVATEGDNRALESAYLAAGLEPGEEILATVRGRIARRMPMEGPGPVLTLIPEIFLGLWPGEDCD